MTKSQVMKALETAGTEQNRKIYGRHGVRGAMFGVSYAKMGELRKQIGTDHELSEALWDSGNHDARVLSCMIADGSQATRANLNAAVREIDNYVLADAFSSFVGRSALAFDRALKWKDAKHDYTGQVGWNLIAGIAMKQGNNLVNEFFIERLQEIEEGIGSAKNRTRHSMNQALIAIGIRNAILRKKAEVTAKRVGHVAVDHGETNCTTPAAMPYIAKAWARRKA